MKTGRGGVQSSVSGIYEKSMSLCTMKMEPDWTNKNMLFDYFCPPKNEMYIPASANS